MNKVLSKYLFYYPATLLRGEKVGKYLSQYEAMQWKSSNEIRRYQEQQLSKLLLHAYSTVPYYKRLFTEAGLKPQDIASIKNLGILPITTKSDIVQFSNDLHSTRHYNFSSDKTTGGSTGQTVTVTKNSDALARERAATWRAYIWAGVTIGDVQARFWGTPLTKKGKFLYKVVDYISNRVRLSAFNLTQDAIGEYYKTLVKLKPVYLYGYVSMIVEFARYISDKNLPAIPGLKSIITTSEVLDPASRKQIESAFKAKVFNEYGCGEVGSIAHECEYGNMHIMAENIIVEIDDEESPGSSSGKIIITDLHNYTMPLIRYDLGDYATLSNFPCKCGRGLPIIEKIHGRAYDIIVDPDGNKHHPEILMYVFEALKSQNACIKQFQIIQKQVNLLEIIIIPENGYKKSTEQEIARKIASDVHPDFHVNIAYTDTIKREKSGKLRIIKSEI